MSRQIKTFGRETSLHRGGQVAHVGPNTPDRAERLTAATGHPFEDVMATCHPPGIAGDDAETSSNTQCAFRQLLKKYGVDFRQSVFVGRETHAHCVDPGGQRGSERSRRS